MTIQELLKTVSDEKNWTDEFFDDNDTFIVHHYDDIRRKLTPLGLFGAFDRAYCERKQPGQVGLIGAEGDNKSIFGIFGIFVTLARNQKKQLAIFPVEVLPDGIRVYIEAVAESLQVPVDMVASFVLAISSLAIQGKYVILVKADWMETLNLYVLVVARPSERKTPTLKEVSKPVFDYVKKENERRQPEIAEYKLKKKILSGKMKGIQEALSKPNNKTKYTFQDALDCQ